AAPDTWSVTQSDVLITPPQGVPVETAEQRPGLRRWPRQMLAATQTWLGHRLTALGKIVRTTAFKLTLVYLTVFSLFAACLLGYSAWNTRRMITEQITRTVDAEIVWLAAQYEQGGLRRLTTIVNARARRPGSSLYLITTFSGDGLIGNVGSLGEGVMSRTGWTETIYRRIDDPEGTEHHALVQVFELPGGGFRL